MTILSLVGIPGYSKQPLQTIHNESKQYMFHIES